MVNIHHLNGESYFVLNHFLQKTFKFNTSSLPNSNKITWWSPNDSSTTEPQPYFQYVFESPSLAM